MATPPKSVCPAGLLDPANLLSNEGIESALNELATVLTESNFANILNDILGQPSVLELVLSNLPDEVPLTQWLLTNFPSDAQHYVDSVYPRVMDRLSTFLLMNSIQSLEISSESTKYITRAPKVLRALLALSFLPPDSECPTLPSSSTYPIFKQQSTSPFTAPSSQPLFTFKETSRNRSSTFSTPSENPFMSSPEPTFMSFFEQKDRFPTSTQPKKNVFLQPTNPFDSIFGANPEPSYSNFPTIGYSQKQTGKNKRTSTRNDFTLEHIFAEPAFGVPSHIPTAKPSQRQAKQMKKLSAKNAPHEQVLREADMFPPHSKANADAMAAEILRKLNDTFKTYLCAIRAPALSQLIRKSFIRVVLPVSLTAVAEQRSIPNHQVDQTEKSRPVAPVVQVAAVNDIVPEAPKPLLNLKLFHYYDTPDGFGEWNILLSSRADRELRNYRRTNSTMYEIVRRKIHDLSNGHFSFDNQKKLTGPVASLGVPIYEAKMTGDLRLIYHIDCITSPTDSQREVQALKIFGFYTHAKMDDRLWDSVSRHLHSQGKEYRLRCLKRERRDGDIGDVYVPASFPPREEEEEDKEEVSPIPTTVHNSNELHSLITLEKYVALSKDVLDSIESGQDAAFPFELSKYEKKIVQYPASCYVLGRSGTGKTTTMLYKMLWVEKAYRLHTANLQLPRQIFVTRSAVLARKVEEHFSTYTSAFRGVKSRSRIVQDEETSSNDLINHNSTSAWKESKLAFSDLEDSDFPLFIPLDDLYYLLESDIDWDGKAADALASSFRPIIELKGKFISFQRFLGEYWPTFSRRLTSALNPALVFNEIIGVILGSERTLTTDVGHLSKEHYLESSRAASSNFSQDQRALIYDVFMLYKELKRQKDDYDISDRSRTIIAAMKHGALNIKKIDYLYVDETQDNLLIDALVLRLICRNPDGLFWAGDTAQTISAGSAFRFDDLKAFMYRVEEERISRMTKDKAEKQLSKVSPHVFQLATNFRSHAGIVDCAHIVVELIKKFFPHTIDMLKRERGVVEGAKPMFCNDFDADQFKEGGSFSSAMISAERIELGAHQCILVRDEEARQRFIEQVGDIGLIVTLYDSKGLEFNDVVLLNFFEDSILTTDQWRVVLNEVSGVYAPKFDLIKHSAICLELKSLYVAITRARNNLRIIDSSEKSEPMKILWEKLGCITEVSFHEAFSNFAVQSSAEDWNHRAKELFDQEKYALARDSYLRGQNPRHAAVANAFYERDRAQRTPNETGRNKTNQRTENFTKAAEAFIRCAEEAGGTAARRRYHQLSGECFEEAVLLRRAVEQYQLAENFTRAAILLRKLGLFDDVRDVLITHAAAIDSTVLESIKDVVRLYYVSSRQYSKAHELFDSIEEEIEYLEDRNLDLAQADLLVSLGRITEAADVHLADGRFEDAVSLLINNNARASFVKATQAVLQGLMTYITFGSDPRNNENADRLLALSRKIPLEVWTEEESNMQEIMMYRFLNGSEIGKLYHLVKTFLACKNTSAALLILDFIFTNTSISNNLDEASKAAQELAHFSSYIELLRDAAFFGDPCEKGNQRFFGVIQHDADTFSFRPKTLFAAFQARKANPFSLSSQGGDVVNMLNKTEIVSSFRQCLQDRLRQRVVEENRLCRQAPAFQPCLRHIALKDCIQALSKCQQPHITTNKDWFLNWLRIHLLQIKIYGSINRVEPPEEFQKEQSFWLKKFFEASNPADYSMGSISHLSVAFYEEMRAPLTIVRSWIREVTSSLDLHPANKFLTMATLTADLAFSFDRKEASLYMYRARFVQKGATPIAFIRGQGQSALLELLYAFDGKHPNSLVMGALVIKHIVDCSLKIDVNVLCTFIERICGQYAALYKYKRNKESFHGLMLPHSWLRRIINEFDTLDVTKKFHAPPYVLLGVLESLIRTLHFEVMDPDNFLLTGQNYTAIPQYLRPIYISRICRVLGLLAYNIFDDQFRSQILGIFKRLAAKGSSASFPRAYRFYVIAQTHGALVNAVRRSLYNSEFDKMIELREASRPWGYQAPGVTRLKYKTYEDLVSIFAATGSSSSLDALEAYDEDANTSATLPDPTQINDEVDGDAVEEEEEEQDRDADEKKEDIPITPAEDVDLKITESIIVEPSPEETANACLIQKVFRHVQGMKKLKDSPGLDGRSYRWFIDCRATLQEERMQKVNNTTSYRLRYLGVLPRLLACIDTICDQLHAAKNEVKKQLNPRRQVKHEMLDELSERLTNLNASMKAVTKFQRNLGLNHPIHQRADIDELRNHVQQVQDALKNRKLPIVISQDVKDSLELVHRIVFKKPSKPTEKMPKKPCLNIGNEEDDL